MMLPQVFLAIALVLASLLAVLTVVPRMPGGDSTGTPPQHPPPQEDVPETMTDCQEAVSALAEFIRDLSLPTVCDKDSECDAFYVGPPCSAPVVWAQSARAVLDAHLEQLGELQGKVRDTCPVPSGVCSPIPARPSCVQGACRDLLSFSEEN